jgi:tRNA-splicing ligase RtcB (3'-phosphate/5'-hydroxy nucleic acid ligase)
MILKQINKTKVPIKIWTEDIENEALEQAIVIADMLPVHSHLALMPDVHAGKGIPIGAVLPLINGISPFAVGSDIGCGMLAVKTHLTDIDIEYQKEIFGKLRDRIPVGHEHRSKSSTPIEWEGFETAPVYSKIIKQELSSARYQLGTLGGGNHFIEVQKGSDGNIWFMIHSGSRNLGKKVADYYHDLAFKNGVVSVAELPYFEMDTDLGKEYFEVMNFSLAFAQKNRDAMADIVIGTFKQVLGDITLVKRINIHHNYANKETHFGKDVILHRKGATLATKDTVGIIPGSQGDPSYIVHGLGNEESFQSCSHGAGRKLSRNKAKKTLNREDEEEHMRSIGIVCDFGRGNLDEAKGAYKDIEVVMRNQDDLVEVLAKLMPYQLPAIKG